MFEPLRAYFDAARKASGLSSTQIQDRMKDLTGRRYVFDRHTLAGRNGNCQRKRNIRPLRLYLPGYYAGNTRTYAGIRGPTPGIRGTHAVRLRSAPRSLYRCLGLCDCAVLQSPPHVKNLFALMEHIITASSRPGDVVLDPFCGSGVTGIAARKHNRRFIELSATRHGRNCLPTH